MVAPDGEVVMMVQGVVSSVEEGLSKGMYMVNAYMGLGVGRGVVGLNPFVRNVYENYLGLFVRVSYMNYCHFMVLNVCPINSCQLCQCH